MKAFFMILSLSYLGIALLLYLFQASFIYFPQPAVKNILADEIQFLNGEQKLKGWVLNKENKNAIIYYGGNAEAIEQNIPFYLTYFPHYTTYFIPYRGYGKNSGHPSEQYLYEDALSIFDQVSKKHQSIILVGRSLGSGIATYVAVNREINQLVLVTPYDSIENIAQEQFPIFPISLLLTEKYLSAARAPQISAKTLVIIAEKDEVIKRKRTDNLVTQFNSDLLTQVVIKQAGHNNLADFPEYLEALKSFIE